MPDVYDQAQRSKVMRSVWSENTKPDIVLPQESKIILVHGRFWHQHPRCQDAARSQSNVDYWNRKLDRNVQRDQRNGATSIAAPYPYYLDL